VLSSLAGAPALLEALPDAVVVADRGGHIAYANPAIAVLLGHDPEELLGRPLQVLMPDRFREAHGEGFSRFRATGQGALVGSTTRVPALHAAGHEVAIDLTLARLVPTALDDDALVVAVLRDASSTVLLERQLAVGRYLAATLRVTAALSEASDADEALDRLLPTLCEHLDWDAASLWQPEGGRLVHAGTWTSPGETVAAMGAAMRTRTFARGAGLPGTAWQQRRPVVMPDLWAEARFLRAAAAREDGLRTGVAFPVLHGGTTLAVVELFSRESRPVPGELVEVLAGTGRQIGQYLGRLRAESEVRKLADTLQRSLLPSRLPDIPGVGIAAGYRAGGELSVVGGDTYDVMPLPDGRWMLLVADVCGTGAEAAAVTSLTRHTARAAAAADADGPADVLCAVNTALLNEQTSGPLRFVTAVCAILEPGTDGHLLRLAVAGHPLPLLRAGGGTPRTVGVAGRPLGIEDDCRFEESTVPLGPGATVVLYTDGATEARDDQGRQLGDEGLLRLLESAPSDADGVVAAVRAGVEAQLRGSRHQADDLAVLALTVQG
jgi:PAS domain S-box-containing protein